MNKPIPDIVELLSQLNTLQLALGALSEIAQGDGKPSARTHIKAEALQGLFGMLQLQAQGALEMADEIEGQMMQSEINSTRKMAA